MAVKKTPSHSPDHVEGVNPVLEALRGTREVYEVYVASQSLEPSAQLRKVIEMANDNTFGLTSWVWTKDIARGMRFANEIAAGTVQLGQGRGNGPEFPWCGYKESGIGKEGSLYGLYEFTNLKRVQVDLVPPMK